jgi:hypothetical protein
MPKCPKCGKEINFLKSYVYSRDEFNFVIDNDGTFDYDYVDNWDCVIDREFCCPECEEILFTDEEDARDFLLGKKVEVSEE